MTYAIITTSDPRQDVMRRFWQHWAEMSEECVQRPAELIVVDDRRLWGEYTDAELQALSPHVPLKIIRPADCLGQARALRLGAETASSELLLFMDPDMIEALSSTAALLQPFADGADAVHGQRCSGASSGLLRRFGSWLFNLTVRLVGGLNVPDINSPVFVHRRTNLALLNAAPANISNPQFALYAQLGNGVAVVRISSQSAARLPSSYRVSELVQLFFRQTADIWKVRRLKR